VRVAPLPTDWQCEIRILQIFRDIRCDVPVLAPLAVTGPPARTAGGWDFRADGNVGDNDRRAAEASLVATTVVVKDGGRSRPLPTFEQNSLRRASARSLTSQPMRAGIRLAYLACWGRMSTSFRNVDHTRVRSSRR